MNWVPKYAWQKSNRQTSKDLADDIHGKFTAHQYKTERAKESSH